MRNWKQFVAGLALLTTLGFAQQDTKPDQKQNPSDVQVEPGPETTEEPRSIFGESMASRFTIVTSATAKADYDDNVFSSGVLRVSDWVSHFSGRITGTMQRKHSLFEVHYLPGYTVYHEFSERNTYDQQGILSWDQQFTAATGMRLNGSVSDYSNASLPPFTLVPQGNTFVPVFAPGGLQNDSRLLSSNTDWTLDHRFSARSSMFVGIDGATADFRNEFGGSGVSSSLSSDTYSVGGNLGWRREVTPGRTLGIEVGHRYFGFRSPSSHTNYSYAKLRFEQKFRQQYTFTVGAGPSFSPIPGQEWNPDYAIDAALTRQTKHTTIGLNVGHETRLSNFQGALGATSANASIGLRGLRRWNTTTTFGYARNSMIGTSADLDTYSGSQRFGYAFSPSWEVFTSYSFISQVGTVTTPHQNFHRNLISFGIKYTLSPAVRY
jgi:hypothetical protein